MVRISSGTWKFIGLVPWSPSAMVYPPCRCGPESRSQPIRAGQQPQKKERTIPRKGQPMFGARGRPSVEKSNEPWATFVSAQLLSTRHMRVCCNGLAPRLTWTSCPQEAAMDEDPGSFGSRLFEDGERFVAMFGEVLLALDGTVPPASMDGEGGVSQGGEGLGGVAGSGAAGVLAAGPIADGVQAVLDSPMPSRDVEQ